MLCPFFGRLARPSSRPLFLHAFLLLLPAFAGSHTVLFSKSLFFGGDTLIQKIVYYVINTNSFRGDLTNISTKSKPLITCTLEDMVHMSDVSLFNSDFFSNQVNIVGIL